MSGFKIKLTKLDDELPYRALRIDYKGKTLNTPIKASNKKFVSSEINEMYRSFTKDTILKGINDSDNERKLNYQIKRQSSDNELNFFIVNYKDTAPLERKEMEFLSDIQYVNSDVIITPIWSALITSDLDIEEKERLYIKYTKEFIEISKTMNNKEILGLVSNRIPRQYLDKIVDCYYNEGVTSFIIDFDGRGMEQAESWIRHFLRILKKEYDLIEKSFLYCVNVPEGKFMKNAEKILAKDFMSYGFSFDSIGLNHIQPKLNSSAWKKIKESKAENTYRLFDRNDYSYSKRLESDLKSKGLLDKNGIKAYNIQQQQEEIKVIRKKLEIDPTLENYLHNKKQIENTKILDKLKKLRNQAYR